MVYDVPPLDDSEIEELAFDDIEGRDPFETGEEEGRFRLEK